MMYHTGHGGPCNVQVFSYGKTLYLLQSADQHRQTMGKFNMFRSPLEASLTVLKQLLRQDVLQLSPAQAADLYRAAIHLLGALKEDQALLHQIE